MFAFCVFLGNKLSTTYYSLIVFRPKMLRVPETWHFPFAGRPSHASLTPPEDGPPPPWIHLPLGFWILCKDLDLSRDRQAQPAQSEGDVFLESNALLINLWLQLHTLIFDFGWLHVTGTASNHGNFVETWWNMPLQFNQTLSSSSVQAHLWNLFG